MSNTESFEQQFRDIKLQLSSLEQAFAQHQAASTNHNYVLRIRELEKTCFGRPCREHPFGDQGLDARVADLETAEKLIVQEVESHTKRIERLETTHRVYAGHTTHLVKRIEDLEKTLAHHTDGIHDAICRVRLDLVDARLDAICRVRLDPVDARLAAINSELDCIAETRNAQQDLNIAIIECVDTLSDDLDVVDAILLETDCKHEALVETCAEMYGEFERRARQADPTPPGAGCERRGVTRRQFRVGGSHIRRNGYGRRVGDTSDGYVNLPTK